MNDGMCVRLRIWNRIEKRLVVLQLQLREAGYKIELYQEPHLQGYGEKYGPHCNRASAAIWNNDMLLAFLNVIARDSITLERRATMTTINESAE